MLTKSLINDYLNDLLLKAIKLPRKEYEEVKRLIAEAKENRLSKIKSITNKIQEMDEWLSSQKEIDKFPQDKLEEYNKLKKKLKTFKNMSPTDMKNFILLLRYPDKVKEFAPIQDKMKDEAVLFSSLIEEPSELSEKYRRLGDQFLDESERHERDKAKKLREGLSQDKKIQDKKIIAAGKKDSQRRSKAEERKRNLMRNLRTKMPESEVPKKLEEYLRTTTPIKPKGIESYSATQLKLIELVGNLTTGKIEENILRLKKFIEEQDLSNDDKIKLGEILEALESDAEKGKTQSSLSNRASPEAMKIKAEGIKLAQRSTGWKKDGGVSLKRTDGKTVSYTSTKAKQIFEGLEKINLRNEKWVNLLPLKPIHEYWVEKSGYKKGSIKFLEEDNNVQSEYISNIVSILPPYPKPTNILKRVYDTFWEDEREVTPSDPENFAYWIRGIQLGLSDKDSSLMDSFLKLQEFSNNTLPRMVDAIKKGIFVDSKGEVSFRLGPQISKLMNSLGTSKQRKVIRQNIIKDIINIIKGTGISSTYSGRDAEELQSVENNIKDILSEKINVVKGKEGKTVLSYLLKTFIELYNDTAIITEILRNPEASNIKVDYVETSPAPSKEDVDDAEKIPYNPEEVNINPKEKGKKTRKWVDKETKKFKRIKNKDGSRKFTDDEIWQKVGWKKVTENKIRRDILNAPIKERVPVLDEEGNPKLDEEGEPITESGTKNIQEKVTSYVRYPSKQKRKDDPLRGFRKSINSTFYDLYLENTSKTLDVLLDSLGESDTIIKEDKGIILDSLDKTQKKKVKAILNIADPTEYFGHDFLKLDDLVKVLKSLGVVKGDKKLNKKILKLENQNLSIVKLATRLRKDYEKLYKQLREMIYPKVSE